MCVCMCMCVYIYVCACVCVCVCVYVCVYVLPFLTIFPSAQAQAQEAIDQVRAKSEVEWKQRAESAREELRGSLSQAQADREAATTEARRYKVRGGDEGKEEGEGW